MKFDERLGLYKVMDRNGSRARRTLLSRLSWDISKSLLREKHINQGKKQSSAINICSKHKPYLITEEPTPSQSATAAPEEEEEVEERNMATLEEKKLEISLEKQPVEKQWNLLGPYLGQYIVYTGPNTAWLL